jgi:mutator protein MutT
MLLVTAAIIEKNGLILAARRKPGSHLAGYWEFPGGKVEADETSEDCLGRELAEEFGVQCAIGDFFGASTYDYGTKIVRLLAYRVQHLSGTFQCRDHDRICWLPVHELPSLPWAPADLPLVLQLREEEQVAATLAYYRHNAREYVQETIELDCTGDMRRHFLELLTPNSLILDLGCGSGRDSRFFLDQGHRVVAIDPVDTIAECAAQYLGHPVRVQKAEEIDEIDTYDGIWACASLLHIPRSRIAATLKIISNALKPQGIWYMSFKQGETENQDRKQRFFNNYSLPAINQVLAQFPQLSIIEISESFALLRGEKQAWLNILVRRK